MPGLLLRWWLRLGCNPYLVFSVLLLRRLTCCGSLGSAPWVRELPWGLYLLLGWQCGGAFWLPMPFGLCYLLRHLLLRFSPSVGAVLCSRLGFPYLRVGALLACGVYSASSRWGLLSRQPLVVGPPSEVSVGPSPALTVGWFGHKFVTPPAASGCWALWGVSVALFCRLGLLRALPCRVFACGFPWLRGPSSSCFLGIFTVVISSRFRRLRMARGGCCLRFVQGPLPPAHAVFFGMRWSWWLSLLLSGQPCVFALGSSSLDLVCVWASTVSFYVFLRDEVTLWVISVLLSLLITNEGLHWWWFLSGLADHLWGA